VHVGTLSPAQPNQEERLGFAVDVRCDLAVVVAYGDSLEGQLFRGSASVYRLGNDGVWEFEQRLVAGDGAALDQFGLAVAIVGEGAARGIVVTAPKGAGAQHPDQGCAYAYELVGGVWTLSSRLTLAVGANNDAFGYSADGSADAVAIGAVFDDATATNQGSASVFRRTGSGAQASWSLGATLVAPELFLPPGERLLRHAGLAADLRDRLARRILRQGVGNLLFRETLLLHANLQAGWRPMCPRELAAGLAQESGGRPQLRSPLGRDLRFDRVHGAFRRFAAIWTRGIADMGVLW
jgi:hypothetical protein